MLEMLYQLMEDYKQDTGSWQRCYSGCTSERVKKGGWRERPPTVKTESLLAVLKAHFLVAHRKLAVSVWILVGKYPCTGGY